MVADVARAAAFFGCASSVLGTGRPNLQKEHSCRRKRFGLCSAHSLRDQGREWEAVPHSWSRASGRSGRPRALSQVRSQRHGEVERQFDTNAGNGRASISLQNHTPGGLALECSGGSTGEKRPQRPLGVARSASGLPAWLLLWAPLMFAVYL